MGLWEVLMNGMAGIFLCVLFDTQGYVFLLVYLGVECNLDIY